MNRAVLRFEHYSHDEWTKKERLRKGEALRQSFRVWRRYYAPAAVVRRVLRRLAPPLPKDDFGFDDPQGSLVPVIGPLRPASSVALQLPPESSTADQPDDTAIGLRLPGK
jgi:hypothetical protein